MHPMLYSTPCLGECGFGLRFDGSALTMKGVRPKKIYAVATSGTFLK